MWTLQDNARTLIFGTILISFAVSTLGYFCNNDYDCVPPGSQICAFNPSAQQRTCYAIKAFGEQCELGQQCQRVNGHYDCVFTTKARPPGRFCACNLQMKYNKTSGLCVDMDYCVKDTDCVYTDKICIGRKCVLKILTSGSKTTIVTTKTTSTKTTTSSRGSSSGSGGKGGLIAGVIVVIVIVVIALGAIMYCKSSGGGTTYVNTSPTVVASAPYGGPTVYPVFVPPIVAPIYVGPTYGGGGGYHHDHHHNHHQTTSETTVTETTTHYDQGPSGTYAGTDMYVPSAAPSYGGGEMYSSSDMYVAGGDY